MDDERAGLWATAGAATLSCHLQESALAIFFYSGSLGKRWLASPDSGTCNLQASGIHLPEISMRRSRRRDVSTVQQNLLLSDI